MTFQFDSLAAFIAMGNHGPFVWSVVVITLVTWGLLVWWPLRSHRQALAEQRRLARIAEARVQQFAESSKE